MNRHTPSFALYCMIVTTITLAIIAVVQWLRS